MKKPFRACGCTLIDLRLVIAGTAMVAARLMPAMAEARTRKTTCANRLDREKMGQTR
jgi:hypothetical protein